VHRESRPPDPVAEVIHRMQKIRDSLRPHDGVACFNRMYLQVTELIGQNLVEDFFADDSFVDRLDVILPDCTSRVWMQSRLVKAQPVLETTIRCPLQPCRMAHPVRVSGVNAHINHDLTLAIIATCQEFGKTPDTAPVHADYQRVKELLAKVESEVRQSFETKLLHVATKDAETLKHIVGSWSITAARDLAWNNTELLWGLRNIPFLFDKSVAALAQRLV
jgi:hypothetical protein